MKPLINVLTRTSNRPVFFSECRRSITGQTYKNIRHIVSYDNEGDLDYLNDYEDITKIKLDREKIRDAWDVDPRKPTEVPEQGHPISVHNLYCNELLDVVEDGWIIFLDDDDKFIDEFVLEKIVNQIEELPKDICEDMMLFWKMTTPHGIKGNMCFQAQRPVLCDIGSPCFTFHSKTKDVSWWDEWKCSDFRFITRLFEQAKGSVWIPEIFIHVKVIGMGNKIDLVSRND